MAQADDPTALWAAPDPEMAAAFQNANDTLDLFLDNTPQNITGKHYQSRITFTRDQIRDWGHLSFDGKLYGHYTTR